MMTKRHTRLETRCDTALYSRLKRICESRQAGVSTVCEEALVAFFSAFQAGHAKPGQRSGFLARPGDSGKKTFEVLLCPMLKNRLRHLAYTLWVSQAEILRRALEYFVYCQAGVMPPCQHSFTMAG